MLKYLINDQDLFEALNETKNFPDLLMIHYSIDAKISKRFPEIEFYNFVFVQESGEKLWISFRDSASTQRSYLTLCALNNANIDVDVVYGTLDLIQEDFPGILTNDFYCFTFHGPKIFYNLFNEWVDEKTYGELQFRAIDTHVFYMTNEQKEAVNKLKIQLPSGYHFVEVNIEKDLEFMTLSQGATDSDFLDMLDMASKLRNMPSSVVKQINDDKLVSFETVDPLGFLHNSYTYAEHRNKGLENAVEQSLTQKLIEKGITPYKLVDITNKDALEVSLGSPYWTRSEHNVEFVVAQKTTT